MSRRYYYQRSRRSINDSRDRMHSYLITPAQFAPLSLSLSALSSLCSCNATDTSRRAKLKRRVESQPETLSKLPSISFSFAVFSLPFLLALFLPSRAERQSASPLPYLPTFFLSFQPCDFYAITFSRVYAFLANCSHFSEYN